MNVVLQRPRAGRARLATLALFLAAGSGIGAWAACIPGVKLRLALSDSVLGLVLLVFAGGAILSMPVAGWLSMRLGSHRVAMVAAGVFGAALILPGVAGTFLLLVGSALLLGAANGLLDVSMNAHATAVERAWGHPIMSSFHAAFSLGGLTGAAGAGALLANGLSVPFCLTIVAVWVLLLVGVAGAADPMRGVQPVPHDATQAAFAWPNRAQFGIGALTFCSMLIEGAMADWSGVFLVTVAGASLGAAASGYAAFSVAMVACRALGDRIVTRFGVVTVVQWGAAVAAGGVTLALIVARPVVSSLGFALVGLGVANMVPVLFSAAGRSRPAAPSVGVAMAATVGYAGFLLGPPVIGLAADLTGLRVALAILVVAAIGVGGVAAATLRSAGSGQAAASRAAT